MILSARSTRLPITDERFRLVQCSECGLVYVNPRPNPQELQGYYSKEYYESNWSVVGELDSRLFLDLNRRIEYVGRYKKSGRVLDVGCGSGDFLGEMKAIGWDVYGVDASRSACDRAVAKIGTNIYCGSLDDCHFVGEFFDVVTMWHVLEHVDDPNATIKEIGRILKNDGLLILEVPNIDSPIYKATRQYYSALDVPRHLIHFSLKTIERLIVRNGFRIIMVNSQTLEMPLIFFHSFLNMLKFGYELSPTKRRFLVILFSPLLITATIEQRMLSLVLPINDVVRVTASKDKEIV